MNGDDWVERALREETADGPLTVSGPLFHATRNLEGIRSREALVPLAVLRKEGTSPSGFGHGVAARGDNHVSLTTSEQRGRAYFDVLVALSAIADGRVKSEEWLRWYFRRWSDGSVDDFLGQVVCPGLELPDVFARSLETVGVIPAWKRPNEVWSEAIAAIDALSTEKKLQWLLDLDGKAMGLGVDVDRGLGIVEADASAWAQLRPSDVGLLRVNLPEHAVGYLHEDEEEVRVSGTLVTFEIIDQGENRLATWSWH